MVKIFRAMQVFSFSITGAPKKRTLQIIAEADDICIVRDGLLTDASICNIALWNGSQWITPASPLLPGTMRASLLDTTKIIPGDIRPDDLLDYSRIRLFNAMIGFGEVELNLNDVL